LALQYLNGEPASNFKRAAEEGVGAASSGIMQKLQKQAPIV